MCGVCVYVRCVCVCVCVCGVCVCVCRLSLVALKDGAYMKGTDRSLVTVSLSRTPGTQTERTNAVAFLVPHMSLSCALIYYAAISTLGEEVEVEVM